MRRSLPLFLPLLLVGTACGDDSDAAESNSDAPTVAVAFYPIEDVVRGIGGDQISVLTLVPAGEEAHEYEPTPQQLEGLEQADVVFYLGSGFQPGVEQAISALPESVARVDLLDGLTLLAVTDALAGTEGEVEGEELADGNDPHVWLDPSNMTAIANTVSSTIEGLSGVDAEQLRTATETYTSALGELDTAFTEGLTECANRTLVTGHRAFAYLASAYDLQQVPIAGISPSEEPSAKSLEAVANFAQENGVTTVFFEENLPDDLAATVAGEIGAQTAALDPLESLSSEQLDAGADYVSVMTDNLAALKAGLGCE
jgi:zinc transport system substrate-binding protein